MHDLPYFQQQFKEYLEARPFLRSPEALYRPVDYILALGGKRLRPAVLLVSHYLFRDDYERSLPAALSLEVFHNFTLLHDDVMDESPLRRGQPTVHERWDQNTAILSGDAMLILAYQLLTDHHIAVPNLLRRFNETTLEVCEGQQFDMNFETRDDVRIDEYIRMIELKTSVLFGFGMEAGARIAGATEADAGNLYEFGRNLGIAFQIQDDLLDTFGTAEQIGKRVGNDILRNKKTYLALRARELADPQQEQELDHWFAHRNHPEEEKIAAVTALFEQTGVRTEAEARKQEFYQTAQQHLAAVKGADPQRVQLLRELGEQLIYRAK